MPPMYEALRVADREIFQALELEVQRQRHHLELIASENYASRPVMQAMGSHFTNKYAEGYPGRRYYGGCVNVDTVEELARLRAKQLFGAEHANVHPHSGAQANMAVYFAVLKPGDTVLGLDLAHGGHLTHGHPLNSSGILYKFVGYHVDRETERVDMDEVRRLALEHKPKLIVVGASAYSRTFDFPAFRAIADEVGALMMVDMAHIAGLVATGHHPSPVPHADFVTTTTHKTLRGPRGGLILCRDKFAKDVDRALFPGVQGGPLMHVIAGKAVALAEALKPEFKVYQEQVIKNAAAMAAALRTTCSWYTLNSGLRASPRATALAATTCMRGPPWTPGNTARSMSLAYFSRHRIRPPRGPRRVLWVVVVTKSAWGTGLGWCPVATRPAMWAISTIMRAPTSSAMARKAGKSKMRE